VSGITSEIAVPLATAVTLALISPATAVCSSTALATLDCRSSISPMSRTMSPIAFAAPELSD
jgi:hypothetical protein